MTPGEKKRIKDFNVEIADNHIQIIIQTSDHPQSAVFAAFGEALAKLLPSVKIRFEDDNDNILLPGVVIGNSLHYHAVPLGQELEPFLGSLKMSADTSGGYAAQLTPKLNGLNSAALFDIFIAPQCPYCPQTVRTLIPLCFSNPLIRVSVIDVTLFQEVATTRGIQSVPTTFLDESFCWTGQVNLNEIINIVENRDPLQLSTESLKKMIHEGLAAKVAEMMVVKGIVFPNFIELLYHPKWTVRLGAMVTVEEIAARDIHLATQIEKPLWSCFLDVEDSVKGDILYTLGEAGNHKTLNRLESILRKSFSDDVKEAAEEAVENIRQRLGLK